MLQGLQMVLMHVPSIAAVHDFYTKQVGFEVADQQPGFIQFQDAGTGAALALTERPVGTPGQSVELWWFVEDVDRSCAAFKEQGIPIVEPLAEKPFGRCFAISDPIGNRLYILQPA